MVIDARCPIGRSGSAPLLHREYHSVAGRDQCGINFRLRGAETALYAPRSAGIHRPIDDHVTLAPLVRFN